MPQLSLSDYIDLVSTTSKSIRSITSQPPPSARPEFYTDAVLRAPLSELIREADPSEVGLFTLAGGESTEIVRAELPNATPLKPTAAKARDGKDGRPKEKEPEVYANAALRYIDRYSAIQAMPRARAQAEYIISKLATVRENIERLNERVKQCEPAAGDTPSVSPQILLQQEEATVQDMQNRIAELKKRKEALSSKKHPFPSSSFRSKPTPRKDLQEESFWNTPGPNIRGMNMTGDLLLNESVNLDDISMASFSSPVPTRVKPDSPTAQLVAEVPDDPFLEPPVLEEPPSHASFAEEVEELAEEDEDMTPQTTPTKAEPQLPVPVAVPTPTPTPGKIPKIRITPDTEKVVAKIWTTVGEVIMPGYQNTLADSKPPRAKETITLLQSISSNTPNPSSPSDVSTSLSSFSLASDLASDQPSSSQILTAHLLLALLSLPPSFSMSLNKMKETLASSMGGGGGLTHTRALYACVAKKLIKIERGKGEQVVKFDI